MTSLKIILTYFFVLILGGLLSMGALEILYAFDLNGPLTVTTEPKQESYGITLLFHLIFAGLGMTYLTLANKAFQQLTGSELIILLPTLILGIINFNSSDWEVCFVVNSLLTLTAYYYIKTGLKKPFKTIPFIIQEVAYLIIFGLAFMFTTDLFSLYYKYTAMDPGFADRNETIINLTFLLILLTHLTTMTIKIIKTRHTILANKHARETL